MSGSRARTAVGWCVACRPLRRALHTTPRRTFSSVDPADVAHFSRLSQHWWDESGEFALLHRMNRVRLEYMRTKIDEVREWDAAVADVLGAPAPRALPPAAFLRSLDLLDVGSGGGLLCEASSH